MCAFASRGHTTHVFNATFFDDFHADTRKTTKKKEILSRLHHRSRRVFSLIIFTGVRFEIDRAEGVRGTGKRVRESVQQRPSPTREGETRSDVTVSVRRRARGTAGSSLRGGY